MDAQQHLKRLTVAAHAAGQSWGRLVAHRGRRQFARPVASSGRSGKGEGMSQNLLTGGGNSSSIIDGNIMPKSQGKSA